MSGRLRARVAADRDAGDRRDRAARARRGGRVPPRARARRVGRADARRGDGAQHPGDPRRRREPHLLRRPLPRVLDLRRRLHADPDRRPRRRRRWPGCTGSASCSTSATTAWRTGPSSTASCSASPRCPTSSASASCPRAACCAARAAAFYLQLIEPEPGIVDVEGDESAAARRPRRARRAARRCSALRAARRRVRRVGRRAHRGARRAHAELRSAA